MVQSVSIGLKIRQIVRLGNSLSTLFGGQRLSVKIEAYLLFIVNK